MNITQRIQNLLDERSWTVYKLIQESKLARSTVNNIFVRGTTPSVDTLESICEAFGISLSEFFEERDFKGMTAEQQNLLNHWAGLTSEQKQTLLKLMEQMNS